MPIHFNEMDVVSEVAGVTSALIVAGIMNAKLTFHLPSNVSFEDCKVVPISQ